MEHSLLMFTLAFALTSLGCAGAVKAQQATTTVKVGHARGLGATWSGPADEDMETVIRQQPPRGEARADLWMAPVNKPGNAEGQLAQVAPNLDRVLTLLTPNDQEVAQGPSRRQVAKAQRLSYPIPNPNSKDQERRYARLERRLDRVQ